MPGTEDARHLRELIALAERIVRESGDPKGFNAEAWVTRWLDNPCPALGGRRPADYMDTEDRRATVFNLVLMQQSGAYA